MTVSILSGRRRNRPFGLAGGEDGAPGETLVRRANGAVELLGAADRTEVAAGDRIEVRTPGGGGWGRAGIEAAGGKAAGRDRTPHEESP